MKSNLKMFAEVAGRVPRAIVRALGAAVAEFTATLNRPEPPEPGSAEDLAQFGVKLDELREALQMFLDDRAVRPRKLRARFSNVIGTNILGYCEIRAFISKPERGAWQVDFERVRAYQSQRRISEDARGQSHRAG